MDFTYSCPLTGKILRKSPDVHNHYKALLRRTLVKQGYAVKDEYDLGTSTKKEEWWAYDDKEWHFLDLWAENGGVQIAFEVIVSESYGNILRKIKKMRETLGDLKIVVFESLQFLDWYWLPRKVAFYEKHIGFKPRSYRVVDQIS